MRGEPRYDVEKFGEAAEATDWGCRPTMQAQREVSARDVPSSKNPPTATEWQRNGFALGNHCKPIKI